MITSTEESDIIEQALTNPLPTNKAVGLVEENVGESLNPRQAKFCELYTGEGEFFGNGVQAYLQVYDIDQTKTGWYGVACAAASRLLSNVKVCNRINSLLEGAGLNKEFMDKQLLYLATQHSDLGHKLGAIKEFNRITRRVEDNPAPVTNVYVVDEAKLQRFREIKKKLEEK